MYGLSFLIHALQQPIHDGYLFALHTVSEFNIISIQLRVRLTILQASQRFQ